MSTNRGDGRDAVRVGVIGLGGPWPLGFRDALSRAGRPSRVVAVCDPVAHRAEVEAERLGCRVAGGPSALIEAPDVEAVFLLGPLWYGDWPIAVALDRGKPVFVSGALRRAALAVIAGRPEADPPLMIELTRRVSAATLRLRELLATELGPPRRLDVKAAVDLGDQPLESAAASAACDLLDGCRSILGDGVASARIVGRGDRPDGRAVRVVEARTDGAEATLTLHVRSRPALGGGSMARLALEAERGRARVDRRGAIRWAVGDRMVIEPAPADLSTIPIQVDQALRLIRGEPSLMPDRTELLVLERFCRLFGA